MHITLNLTRKAPPSTQKAHFKRVKGPTYASLEKDPLRINTASSDF